MSDTTKIVCSIGLGLYYSVGRHLYLILGTRVRNIGPVLGLLLYFVTVALLIGGSIVGLFAINGVFDHDRQMPIPHGKNMFIFTFASYFATILIYSILNRHNTRRLKQLNNEYVGDGFLAIYARRRASHISIPKKNWKIGAAMSLFAAVCFGGAAIIYAKSSKPDLAILYCSLTTLYFVLSAVFFKKSKQP
jgi:hypothetical protein